MSNEALGKRFQGWPFEESAMRERPTTNDRFFKPLQVLRGARSERVAGGEGTR